jgi:hypothetical protein
LGTPSAPILILRIFIEGTLLSPIGYGFLWLSQATKSNPLIDVKRIVSPKFPQFYREGGCL